ncbi:response regulator transcription factor [Micromonospora sp. DR5-3]|uniref:response regulator n=1 Tax=unclassified Micromonospora TaxID=2617518 RepID=UPI0011D2FE47|nr:MULTISPECIES: response regulator transcription factor [unclassified Micromonospora]MCW3819468.1 response regulator transcription factor [Micromonospora sp. DR5-3]TYC19158.1 response regulator transcription factor [Micromonospora sp. MP36]
MTGSAVRVVIADDHTLLRDSFRMLIDSTPGLGVVGEAASGAEAVTVCRRERPDVVLMDIRMPDVDGIEATRRICAGPDTRGSRVLILTTFDLDEYVFGALRAGASGFPVKDASAADLLAAIRVVAAGEALLAPTVTRRLIAAFTARPPERAGTSPLLDRLTVREREVLTLIARGRSNTELATELCLSHGTVKTYVGRLLSKLDVRDRAQLVILAYETGLVTPQG